MLEYITTIVPHFPMWCSFFAILCAIYAYASEKLSIDETSVYLIGFFLLFFSILPIKESGVTLLSAPQLISGFANPALITVMSMLIMGRAIVLSGSLNSTVDIISGIGKKRPRLAISLTLCVVCVVSAMMNNTPVVVIFIPILGHIARKFKIPSSKIMMPLAFAASLGGMMTMIGNSTSMLISAKIEEINHIDVLGIFYCTAPGILLCSIGMIYVLLIMPLLLPDRSSVKSSLVGDDSSSDGKFLAEIKIACDSNLLRKTISELKEYLTDGVEINFLQRKEKQFYSPDNDMKLKIWDTIVVSATKESFARLASNHPEMILQTLGDASDAEQNKSLHKNLIIVEAIIAPASRMIGSSLQQSSFHYLSNAIVLGIQRRSNFMRAKISELRLQAGDVVLLIGDRDELQDINENKDLLLLEPSGEEVPNKERILKVNAIAICAVSLAVMNVFPILVSAFLGCVTMLLTRCITLQQMCDAIDRQVFLVISAAYMMSMVIERTGGAQYIVDGILYAFQGQSPFLVMSAMFLLVMFFNELMSNNATGLLFAPIAIRTAEQLSASQGLDADACMQMFIWAIIFAGSCCFATPIGYQTNLLVMAPGNYRFKDYLKAGLPLGLLIWASYTTFACFYFTL